MRWLVVLVCMFLAGCGARRDPEADTAAAKAFVERMHNNVASIVLEKVAGPEYATVAQIPGSHKVKPSGTPAACAVRVKWVTHDEGSTVHDDWLIWVDDHHKAFDWSSSTTGDNWRTFVQSVAAK